MIDEVKHCKYCKKVLRASNKSGICSNCFTHEHRKDIRIRSESIDLRKEGKGKRRTLNVTIEKELWNKLNSYFEENSINKAKWFTKLIEEKLDKVL